MNKTKNILHVVSAFIWFAAVSFVLVNIDYESKIGHSLAYVIVPIVAFFPSGLLVAYPYVIQNFREYRWARIIFLSFLIAMALFIPFAWFDLAASPGK